MIRNGTATVYEAKFGSEFAGLEDVYRNAEEQARKSGKGMWNNTPGLVGRLLGQQEKARESPREYKTRMKLEDQAK
jgi:endonuclease YncB( thermonuclease family)